MRRNARRFRRLRQRAHARATAADRSRSGAQDHRSHAAHPRHLRPPGADPRRQAPGRARAAAISAAAARRIRRGAVAAGRRHRHERPRRNQARNRSPPDSHAHPRRQPGHRAGAAAARAAARAAPQGVGADGGAGRVHQRRQDDALQRADARGRGGVGRAVRDARSAHPAGAPAGQPGAAGFGHGRVHRPAAARAGRGVPRHARGRRGRGSRSSTSSTRRPPTAIAAWTPCGRCSKRSAPPRCR